MYVLAIKKTLIIIMDKYFELTVCPTSFKNNTEKHNKHPLIVAKRAKHNNMNISEITRRISIKMGYLSDLETVYECQQNTNCL